MLHADIDTNPSPKRGKGTSNSIVKAYLVGGGIGSDLLPKYRPRGTGIFRG